MTGDLRIRVITGSVLSAIVVAWLLLASQSCTLHVTLVWAVTIFVLLAAWEAGRLIAAVGAERWLATAIIMFPIIVCGIVASQADCELGISNAHVSAYAASATVLAALILWGFMCAGAREDREHMRLQSAEWLPALCHIGMGGACLVLMASPGNSLASFTWLIAVVAAGDTAAYFGGSYFGGRTLAPALSPKKTISGTCAGLAASALVGIMCGILLLDHMQPLSYGLYGLLIGVAEQLGDLNKSYLKRLHDVKDSGTLFPGHGGAYDRLDGLLAAACVWSSVQVLFP